MVAVWRPPAAVTGSEKNQTPGAYRAAEAGPEFTRQLWWIGKQASRRPLPRTLSADQAACVTGVPLRQMRQIINAGLLGSAAARRERSRTVHREGSVSLKLA